jgi:hypothetical protein
LTYLKQLFYSISKHHSINFGSFEMQPSTQELEIAFNRVESTLRGVTFEQALLMPAIKTCLTRMALNAQQPKIKPVKVSRSSFKPTRVYWWHLI